MREKAEREGEEGGSERGRRFRFRFASRFWTQCRAETGCPRAVLSILASAAAPVTRISSPSSGKSTAHFRGAPTASAEESFHPSRQISLADFVSQHQIVSHGPLFVFPIKPPASRRRAASSLSLARCLLHAHNTCTSTLGTPKSNLCP